MNKSSFSFVATLFVLAGLLTGCQESGISVQGQITVDGEPLEAAEIRFLPTSSNDREHLGAVVTDGRYAVAGSDRVREGEYQVQIRAYRSSGKKVWDGMGDGKTKTMVDDFKQFIPNRYNDASELVINLQEGKNEFTTNLETSRQ